MSCTDFYQISSSRTNWDNSSKLNCPSSSVSKALINSLTSSTVSLSPTLQSSVNNSCWETDPLSSLSKTLKKINRSRGLVETRDQLYNLNHRRFSWSTKLLILWRPFKKNGQKSNLCTKFWLITLIKNKMWEKIKLFSEESSPKINNLIKS